MGLTDYRQTVINTDYRQIGKKLLITDRKISTDNRHGSTLWGCLHSELMLYVLFLKHVSSILYDLFLV